MKRFKIRKLAFVTAVCSMSLLFTVPGFTMPVCAATPPSSETVSPQADVLSWIYMRDGDDVWKRLYNGTTGEWVGDWIYVGKVGSGIVNPNP